MLLRPDTFIIGAAARKTGKTAFACRVIGNLAPRVAVIGIKITPAHEDEPCPKDGDGGGECREFDGPFRITEAASPSSATDTGRMLQAGASRAFWLQVRREHLREAVETLFAGIPEGACIVAEGNSVRTVLEPGLFVLLREKANPETKPSFREALPQADRVGLFDGREWDFPPEDCRFFDGRWFIRPRASAVILAGGDSRRMGLDKALLPIAGKPLIARIADRLKELFAEVIVGANRIEDYRFLDLEIVPDREPGQGPLMGIASCLERAAEDLAFVTACDVPEIDLSFIHRLIGLARGYDMVLPVTGDRRYEPLFAVYRKTVVPAALDILRQGGRRIIDLLDRVDVRLVEVSGTDLFRNINTLDDYRKYVGGCWGVRS